MVPGTLEPLYKHPCRIQPNCGVHSITLSQDCTIILWKRYGKRIEMSFGSQLMIFFGYICWKSPNLFFRNSSAPKIIGMTMIPFRAASLTAALTSAIPFCLLPYALGSPSERINSIFFARVGYSVPSPPLECGQNLHCTHSGKSLINCYSKRLYDFSSQMTLG